jgi:hypothetical protein
MNQNSIHDTREAAVELSQAMEPAFDEEARGC